MTYRDTQPRLCLRWVLLLASTMRCCCHCCCDRAPVCLSCQALQAPACHENMVKVGGYILGEFGNLIAGDPRSGWVIAPSVYCTSSAADHADAILISLRPSVQLKLLHSKFHLCSPATRGLLLSTYVKFANLFPEIKPQIQEVSQCSLPSAMFATFTVWPHSLSVFLCIGVQQHQPVSECWCGVAAEIYRVSEVNQCRFHWCPSKLPRTLPWPLSNLPLRHCPSAVLPLSIVWQPLLTYDWPDVGYCSGRDATFPGARVVYPCQAEEEEAWGAGRRWSEAVSSLQDASCPDQQYRRPNWTNQTSWGRSGIADLTGRWETVSVLIGSFGCSNKPPTCWACPHRPPTPLLHLPIQSSSMYSRQHRQLVRPSNRTEFTLSPAKRALKSLLSIGQRLIEGLVCL